MDRIGVLFLAASLAISFAGCSSTAWRAAYEEAPTSSVDVAIITVLPQEYRAVLGKLENVRSVIARDDKPNVYLWALGEIHRTGRKKPVRVVVAMAAEAGEVSGALAARATIDRWRPRDVLLVGIAGGTHDAVNVGDVVISNQIWAYEHGHLGRHYDAGGSFYFVADSALVRAAAGVGPEWRRRIDTPPPEEGHVPEVVVGKTASGNKVIENSSSTYFAETLRMNTSIVSVEMEGAGVAAAVARDRDMGGTTGFLMIRGISDLVESGILERGRRVEQGRNPQRDLWKNYASEVAASFAVVLIETNWPD